MYPSMKAELAARDGDLRLYLLLGIAAWFLFLDHIPHNAVSLLTMRNFGFSGATDLFVFVGGYTAAILYGRMMLERGFVVTATRIFKRLWQLYAAYIVLFVIYINLIGYVATPIRRARTYRRIQRHGNRRSYDPDADLRPAASGQAAEPRCAATVHRADGSLPVRPVRHGPPAECHRGGIDWSLPRSPSIRLEFVCVSGRTLVSQPVLLATAVRARRLACIERPEANAAPCVRFRNSPILRVAAWLYLLFALAVTVAGKISRKPVSSRISCSTSFCPNDRENLAPHRVLHFLALAFLFTYMVPRDWPGFRWQTLQPVIKCGEEWLAVFCAGVFLSFAATPCPDHGPGFARHARPGQRCRDFDHDGRGLLRVVVQTAGPQARHSEPRPMTGLPRKAGFAK